MKGIKLLWQQYEISPKEVSVVIGISVIVVSAVLCEK